MRREGSRGVWLVLAAVAAMVAVFLLLRAHTQSTRADAGVTESVAYSAQVARSGPGQPSITTNEEPSHLADGLNDTRGDIDSDLRIVGSLLEAYRSALHSGNPVGENAEITAALTGKNRIGFAFIDPRNPAINRKGELCDRWGTPFFFHSLSEGQMEIRSAGPDKQLWNADDVVLAPAGGPPVHL